MYIFEAISNSGNICKLKEALDTVDISTIVQLYMYTGRVIKN